MSWVEAVKAYAAEKGTAFKLPKRDTPEYDAIKSIQEKLKAKVESPVAAEAKPLKKVKAAKIANVEHVVAVEAPVVEVQKKRKSPGPKVANVEAKDIPAVVQEVLPEVKKRVKKVKEVIKVANVEPIMINIAEEPVAVVVKKEKKVKVANVVPVEVEAEVKPEIKVPKPSAKEARATKALKLSATKEVDSKTAAKKALDDARMIILDKPISFRFD